MIATILLLALTVTLFASVFFFINTFPHPPPQPANQFSASLSYSGINIVAVNILHLAGPTIAGTSITQTAIYLQSAAQPHVFTAPFSLANGLNGSTVWSLGQTWRLNVTAYSLIATGENITISIISSSQLLFRITLPGANPLTTPIFSQAGITPSSPGPSQPFTVYVGISDPNLNASSVYVNLSEIPGVTGTGLHPMTYLATSGLWIYTLASGSSSVGTFYAFVNASDASSFIQNSIAIPVTISNSGSTSGVLQIQTNANNTQPVVGLPVQLEATVSNTGGSAASVVVQFYVGGTAVGSPTSQGITAGSSAVYTQAWTPSATGTQAISAIATESGASAENGFPITVYPKILFIPHAYPAGSYPASNTSADIAKDLTSNGVPFTTTPVACGTALPSAAVMSAYKVVIIDFGSATGLACSQLPPSSTEQAKITADATTTNFWLIGANGFSATACTSYSSAFQTQFGLATSGTCTTAKTTTTTLTYTASATTPTLRADGLTGITLSLNQTFAGSAAFEPYYSLALQASGKPWLKDSSSNTIGVYTNTTTDHQQMALATDPTLITSKTPNGQTWGVAAGADAAVVYNAIDFLCGFATTGNSGHGLPNFGIAGAEMIGLKHGLTTQFYVAVRADGAEGGAVYATLYVNGTPAFYLGSLVTGAATIGPYGNWTWIAFNWSAPGAGSYALSIGITSENPDYLLSNNLMPISFYNRVTTFT